MIDLTPIGWGLAAIALSGYFSISEWVDSKVKIEEEKTKQLELQLEIEQEKKDGDSK